MQRNAHRVGVIGAGPGGLSTVASLLEQAENHPDKIFKVDIFDKRNNNHVRRQKVAIRRGVDPGSMDWQTYCKKLFDPNNKISIDKFAGVLKYDGKVIPPEQLNARQKFLLRLETTNKATILYGPQNFSIRSIQKALEEHIKEKNLPNVEINWHWEANNLDINLKKQQIFSPKDNKLHEFDTLVMSEGDRRELTTKLNSTMKSKDQFKFSRTGEEMYSCGIRIKIDESIAKLSEDEKARLIREQTETQFSDMKKLGWDPKLSYFTEIGRNLPVFAFDGNHQFDENKRAGYLVAQIPKSIHDISDPEEKRKVILEYARTLAFKNLQVPKECIVIDTKGETETQKMNAVTFSSVTHAVDDPVRKLPKGGNIVLVGDCAMSAYWLLGFSSSIALNEGMKVAECIVQSNQGKINFKPVVELYHHYENLLTTTISQHLEKSSLPIANMIKSLSLIKKFDAEYTSDMKAFFTAISKKVDSNPNYLEVVKDIEKLYDRKKQTAGIPLRALNKKDNSDKNHCLRIIGLALQEYYSKFPSNAGLDPAQIKRKSELSVLERPERYVQLASQNATEASTHAGKLAPTKTISEKKVMPKEVEEKTEGYRSSGIRMGR